MFSFHRGRRSWAALLGGLCLTGAVLQSPAWARSIQDMAGQTVEVPDEIHHVYAMTHAFPLVTAIAPDLLAGFAFQNRPNDDIMRFLPPSMAALPQLGGASQANLEKLKDAGIDLALGWTSTNEQYPTQQLNRIGVPVVFIDVDRLDQYPGTFRFLGRLLHREDRGELLAHNLEDILTRLHHATDGLSTPARPRVYYAESLDGLTSQCDSSDRAEVITLAGGVNALHCDGPAGMKSNYPIDIETLLTVDPDVIVTRFAKTAEAVRQDPRWQKLTAVRNGKVYAVPALPFNWFDRPPSFLRAMGAQWLANLLHPDLYPLDLRAETRRFDQVFLGVTPSDADLDRLFQP